LFYRDPATAAPEEEWIMGKLRVKVDLALCQGHAVCMQEAPEVFRVNETDSHYPKVEVLLEYPREDLRQKVLDAVRYCPNRTISVEEIPD
jgi:sterol 14-demethylase